MGYYAVFLILMTCFLQALGKNYKTLQDEPGQQCEVLHQKVGCFKDDMISPRPLPELLLTDRDLGSAVSSNSSIDWENWNGYLSDIVCRCAKAAKKHKFKYFGIQYYGECWSGKHTMDTFHRAGSATTCVSIDFEQCQLVSSSPCVGKIKTNFVYQLPEEHVGSTCAMGFDKVGCFGDNLSKPRPLPRMIFTDKDINSPIYSGEPLDWAKWNEYIIGLACRCADAASQMGYSYFSLQSYGECWSGQDDEVAFLRGGESETCVGPDLKLCEPDHPICVGRTKTDYVYRLHELSEVIKKTS